MLSVAKLATVLQRALNLLVFPVVLIGTLGFANPALAGEQSAWSALRSGGHVALLRHAIAPGTGDPAEFNLGDCSTQRNLSQRGREQAARIGERFREKGIETARVYSSQWCRCKDTAELLKLGPVNELPALNSFYQRWENRDGQTNALRAWLRRVDLNDVNILVTHQVNITELTGVYPSSGELVIVRLQKDGELRVSGTIQTD